ncbi:hypothetical protein BATDEDRAFT_22423 [Batrachochytrium dendrobatidis JAM81]|uniref:Uncharacterized protein n=2 Tax=Batrachochytrium dendrobatidis TaxID=109871 RepID=F4NUF4_BATDJ|nr:uncharacterized protein BATDEDRAFT_22423 [Batrachochytrium dendrobatidis JAM81]EGF83597.1 hypothetical protein BATDEDRAFT_22423 [Batrachochytrium dendrobatidis JAM81]OAJ37419.1 hypothetical protein BDEG_21439 [Batrachochytrium dendrobatidis JEL423]|eukprot:XP_006675565.1 hypothetical protein BATDEDRAFT_22423 [Batrachochytrium dendrobatidis JAM81]
METFQALTDSGLSRVDESEQLRIDIKVATQEISNLKSKVLLLENRLRELEICKKYPELREFHTVYPDGTPIPTLPEYCLPSPVQSEKNILVQTQKLDSKGHVNTDSQSIVDKTEQQGTCMFDSITSTQVALPPLLPSPISPIDCITLPVDDVTRPRYPIKPNASMPYSLSCSALSVKQKDMPRLMLDSTDACVSSSRSNTSQSNSLDCTRTPTLSNQVEMHSPNFQKNALSQHIQSLKSETDFSSQVRSTHISRRASEARQMPFSSAYSITDQNKIQELNNNSVSLMSIADDMSAMVAAESEISLLSFYAFEDSSMTQLHERNSISMRSKSVANSSEGNRYMGSELRSAKVIGAQSTNGWSENKWTKMVAQEPKPAEPFQPQQVDIETKNHDILSINNSTNAPTIAIEKQDAINPSQYYTDSMVMNRPSTKSFDFLSNNSTAAICELDRLFIQRLMAETTFKSFIPRPVFSSAKVLAEYANLFEKANDFLVQLEEYNTKCHITVEKALSAQMPSSDARPRSFSVQPIQYTMENNDTSRLHISTAQPSRQRSRSESPKCTQVKSMDLSYTSTALSNPRSFASIIQPLVIAKSKFRQHCVRSLSTPPNNQTSNSTRKGWNSSCHVGSTPVYRGASLRNKDTYSRDENATDDTGDNMVDVWSSPTNTSLQHHTNLSNRSSLFGQVIKLDEEKNTRPKTSRGRVSTSDKHEQVNLQEGCALDSNQ